MNAIARCLRARHLACIAALLILSACRTDSGPSDAGEFLELPGPFSERTTVAELQERFGAANAVVTSLPDGVDGPERGVVLFPDDPSRRAVVLFHDAASLTGLASITVTERRSRWRGKRGVRIGMSFGELRARNGKPFAFSGFDDEGRGRVRGAWDAGALDVYGADALHFGVDLRVREAAAAAPTTALPRDETQLSSDDPRYPLLGDLAEVSAISAWSSLDDEW
jgi:hypothetical protein